MNRLEPNASLWSQILPDTAARQARQLVREIADIGLRPYVPSTTLSSDPETLPAPLEATLSRGYAGMALFYGHLSRSELARPGDAELARHLLSCSVEVLARTPMRPYLFTGFTGIAWVTEHLSQLLEVSPATDPNEEIDLALRDFLRSRPADLPYDLLVGLVGIGVYALERLPRSVPKECLDEIVSLLAARCVRSREGIVWPTQVAHLPAYEREEWPKGRIDLGLAHGSAGAVAFLAQYQASGYAPAAVLSLIEEAIMWIRARKRTSAARDRFPFLIGPDGEKDAWIPPGRLGWCYGDLGVATALLLAGRACGNDEWSREAIQIAIASARKPLSNVPVFEAGVCHGAAGVGAMLSRFYHVCRQRGLETASTAWFSRVFTLRNRTEGILGFARAERPFGEELRWVADPGFLSGLSGIGLALLSAATEHRPSWDRVLLLSARGSDQGASFA